MSAIVKAAIAEFLAIEERVVDVPTGELGYGSDISCAVDVDARMSEVDPFSTRAIAEALVRRLDCPRGALVDDPDYGLDVRGMLNRGTPATEIQALAGQIRSECQKDDRVDDVRVIVTPSPTGRELRIQLHVTPIDPEVGGFSLTFAVTSLELLLEELVDESGASLPGGLPPLGEG